MSSTEARIAQQTKEKEKLRSQELTDIREVMKSAAGRRYIWGLLEHCGVFRSSFHPSAQIYFNEGVRSVGLKMIADLGEADPDSMMILMQENHSN